MSVKKKQLKELIKDSTLLKQTENAILPQLPRSLNEIPVNLLDPVLTCWVRVIKPSRASLTYERFE